MKNIFKQIIINQRHKKWTKELRKRNKNKNFTLITNNCIGGVIYHDLGIPFYSPTINCTIQDFPLFINYFEHYMTCDLIEIKSDQPFPVGILKSDKYPSITIWFNHYKSFVEAKEKWIERKKRINYSNIFFLMECYSHIYEEEFNQYLNLPMKDNKVVLIHVPETTREDVHFIPCDTGTKDNPVFGKIFEINDDGKRALDEFDYVSFLNRE